MNITTITPAAPGTFAAYRSTSTGPVSVELVAATATTESGSTLVLSHGALAALGSDTSTAAARQPFWTGQAADAADALARATA